MHDTGCLGLVHWDDPEGWYGYEEGGGFRMGTTCMPVADSFLYMAEPISIVKFKNKIKLKKKKKLSLDQLLCCVKPWLENLVPEMGDGDIWTDAPGFLISMATLLPWNASIEVAHLFLLRALAPAGWSCTGFSPDKPSRELLSPSTSED